jgi:hypothetical protein
MVINLKIDVNGDAYRLLEHFVEYSSGARSEDVADVMCYDREAFLVRALYLKKAFLKAAEDKQCSE